MNYQSYREYSRIEQRLMALQAWHCIIFFKQKTAYEIRIRDWS
eukprot:COSAG03_NODE_26030_length_262_cov_0.312883_1_plen_42_part_10